MHSRRDERDVFKSDLEWKNVNYPDKINKKDR